MVYQTYVIIIEKPVNLYMLGFVFFSTVCSYNFHWALTPNSIAPSLRLQWDKNHKNYHLLLSFAGGFLSLLFFIFLKKSWLFIIPAAILTFLYSAPKIPLPVFQLLKKVAIGKTIFLAMIWAYVTSFMPVLVENDISIKPILFFIGQFFFIYAICILFDFRDKDDDKAEGIRSMITYFDERGINILFIISILVFTIICLFLKTMGIEWINILLLLSPAFILAGLFQYAKKNFSDYLYYFILDGLMMLSALLLWLVNRF